MPEYHFKFAIEEEGGESLAKCEACGVLTNKIRYYRGVKLCRECYEREVGLDTEEEVEQEDLDETEEEAYYIFGGGLTD